MARHKSQQRERQTHHIFWHGLISPAKRLERKVRIRGYLDAWRGVGRRDVIPAQRQADPGKGRRDAFYAVESQGDYYPPVIGDLAAWCTATLQALGATAQRDVGWHTARVEGLKSHIASGEQALAGGQELGDQPAVIVGTGDGASSRSASRPEAQHRRRAARAAQARAVQEQALVALRAELAEAIALRFATVAPLRETAMQIHEFGCSTQELYWSVRMRWARKKHGGSAALTAAYIRITLPAWIVDDDALFDVTPKSKAIPTQTAA